MTGLERRENVDRRGGYGRCIAMDRSTREARRKQLLALHKRGLGGPAIALKMGITRQRVHQLRLAMGLPTLSQTEEANLRRKTIEPLIRSRNPPHIILRKIKGLSHDQLYRDARALGLYDTLRQSWLDAVAAGYQPKRKAPAP